MIITISKHVDRRTQEWTAYCFSGEGWVNTWLGLTGTGKPYQKVLIRWQKLTCTLSGHVFRYSGSHFEITHSPRKVNGRKSLPI